jgi:hypothetical protein
VQELRACSVSLLVTESCKSCLPACYFSVRTHSIRTYIASTPHARLTACMRAASRPEDLLTGRAMSRINIDYLPHECLDAEGRQLFLPLGGNFEWNAKDTPPDFWFWRMAPGGGVAGPKCCSLQWIGTHYVSPSMMFMLDDYESVRCRSNTAAWPHLQLGSGDDYD